MASIEGTFLGISLFLLASTASAFLATRGTIRHRPFGTRSSSCSSGSGVTVSQSAHTSTDSSEGPRGKYKCLLLEIPHASKTKSDIPQLVANDDLITRAVADVSESLFIYVRADPSASRASVYEYISDVYTRAWDEMVSRDILGIDCTVIGDVQNSGFISRPQLYGLSELDAVYSSHVAEVEGFKAGRLAAGLPDFAIEDISTTSPPSSSSSSSSTSPSAKIYYFDAVDEIIPNFKRVALGGTFDQLHNGHRKLLTLAAGVCTDALIIGITGDEMLKKKKNASHIAGFDFRKSDVKMFLDCVKPSLRAEISELRDPFGPAITDPTIEAIVVSSETLTGAFKINEIRKGKGFKELAVLVTRRTNAATLSSTFIRDKASAKGGNKRRAIKRFFHNLIYGSK